MTSLSSLKASEVLRKKGIKFVDKGQISRIFSIKNSNTTYKLLQRLEANNILQRVTKGIYIVTSSEVNDFEIANAALKPSYISLESALSFYGILPQFPYSITSVTIRRSRRFNYKKEFEYTHIDSGLYWGFIKNDNFVIASAEKALLDMIYLSTKGLRKIDLQELDLSLLNRKLIKSYSKKINKRSVSKVLIKNKLI